MAIDTTISLTTLAKVKTFLRITSSSFDSELEALIDSFSRFISNQTGRILKEADITQELHSGKGEQFLVLKNLPATDITAFEYADGDLGSRTWTAFDSDEYELDPDSGRIYVPGGVPYGFNNIRVSYTAGYATIPADLEELANAMVAKVFDDARSQGKSSEGIDGANIQWRNRFNIEQQMIFDNYKDHKIV